MAMIKAVSEQSTRGPSEGIREAGNWPNFKEGSPNAAVVTGQTSGAGPAAKLYSTIRYLEAGINIDCGSFQVILVAGFTKTYCTAYAFGVSDVSDAMKKSFEF